MAKRPILKKMLEHLGLKTYYDPPEDIRMSYPCVVYNFDGVDSSYADNSKYLKTEVYSLKYITYDVDDPMVDEINDLQFCELSKPHYTVDGLHHFVFTIKI